MVLGRSEWISECSSRRRSRSGISSLRSVYRDFKSELGMKKFMRWIRRVFSHDAPNLPMVEMSSPIVVEPIIEDMAPLAIVDVTPIVVETKHVKCYSDCGSVTSFT